MIINNRRRIAIVLHRREKLVKLINEELAKGLKKDSKNLKTYLDQFKDLGIELNRLKGKI